MSFTMKKFFTFAAILPSTYAAWANLTLGDYTLKQSGYSATIANLDKALPNVKVKDIMDDLNHVNPAAAPNIKHIVASSAYKWESSSDFNDQDTKNWYPQGITTSADAYDSGEYEGQRLQLVTWHSDHYDDGKRGARVSFVSQGGKAKKYRHVLLVEPKGDDNFEAIKGLHAGGLTWYGNLVYVVDTTGGLRVFDLDHLYKVDTTIDDSIGKQSGGKYGAYGYKYVLPQVRSYDWQAKTGLTSLRFSFISLDRTTTPDSILVGEYHATRTDCRLVRWDIDYTNRLLKTSNNIATASQAVSHGNTKIQGAASINGKFFLTQSGGDMISYSWKDGKKTTENTFPSVPEDLSYEKGVGLWTLMEQEGEDRSVFSVDPDKF
ncbi:hypothetical protein CC80DRAFT_493705 [Byssothecium circinans]|uniref:Secreted protein n=1 Tax=Byssothecium circinans TaxID=147558 RepID=A0A6A5TPK1_9PLEO|nr:hypothetical protein CC80DRAFT_493705 [Byssothecium circinans]